MTAAAPPGRPTADHLLLLRRLRRLVLRVQSAQLLYLWGDDPRSLAWLQGELDRTLRARSRRLLAVPAASGGAPEVEAALHAVLLPERGAELFGVWVDLGDARGRPQRDWLLARLNERRAGLLAVARPVLLVGRGDAAFPVAMVAPDLWSIRSASFTVPAWAVDGALGLALPTPWRGEGLPPSSGHLAAVALWDRALASFQQASAPGDAAARARADDASPRLALDLGFDAIAQAVRYRQPALAERVLADLAAHLVIDPAAVGDQPQTLRQAYQWQLWAAELAGLRRQWRDAQAHAVHALALVERLVKLTGDSPEALRDWSVSLEKVGDVQRALGDLAGARERHEQSLRVRERLVKRTGESPEALRDWSISLSKVGDVQRALGDVAGARERYEQSLQVSERLVQLTGDSPEALRDWSVSLEKVGDVQRTLGDVAGASERYAQSLQVRERLVQLTGESPEALRDLAISCQRLGDLQAATGAPDAARAWFERDLQAAEAALRQSPLSQDIQDVVAYARRRLAELAAPPADPAP